MGLCVSVFWSCVSPPRTKTLSARPSLPCPTCLRKCSAQTAPPRDSCNETTLTFAYLNRCPSSLSTCLFTSLVFCLFTLVGTNFVHLVHAHLWSNPYLPPPHLPSPLLSIGSYPSLRPSICSKQTSRGQVRPLSLVQRRPRFAQHQGQTH